jgi:hypothetical protein
MMMEVKISLLVLHRVERIFLATRSYISDRRCGPRLRLLSRVSSVLLGIVAATVMEENFITQGVNFTPQDAVGRTRLGSHS